MYQLRIRFSNYHTVGTYMFNVVTLATVIKEAKYQASITPVNTGVIYEVSDEREIVFKISAHEPI